MADEEHQLRSIGHRIGVFDGRTIRGSHFEDERAMRGWHISTWTQEHGVVDDYWVSGENFYEMLRLDIAGYPGVNNRIEIGGRVIEMDETKRTTILKALAQWEVEENENPCT